MHKMLRVRKEVQKTEKGSKCGYAKWRMAACTRCSVPDSWKSGRLESWSGAGVHGAGPCGGAGRALTSTPNASIAMHIRSFNFAAVTLLIKSNQTPHVEIRL